MQNFKNDKMNKFLSFRCHLKFSKFNLNKIFRSILFMTEKISFKILKYKLFKLLTKICNLIDFTN